MKQKVNSKDKITVLAEGLRFPEGPAFALDGSLWIVELHGKSLVQFINGELKRIEVGGKPNGIAFDNVGNLWFCDAEKDAIRRLPKGAEYAETIIKTVNSETLNNPNDLAFDAVGNLVFTCPGNSRSEPSGYVCVLEKNGTVKKIVEDKYFPNGLAFSNDGKQLIIAETYKHRLCRGNWDSERCEWTETVVFAEVGGPIGPDGMAFDEEGNLYVAIYGQGRIKVINNHGEIIDELILPGNNPTNCAFDPSGKLGLVVTEAENGTLLNIKK